MPAKRFRLFDALWFSCAARVTVQRRPLLMSHVAEKSGGRGSAKRSGAPAERLPGLSLDWVCSIGYRPDHVEHDGRCHRVGPAELIRWSKADILLEVSLRLTGSFHPRPPYFFPLRY